MDINTITEVLRPRARDEIGSARPGDAFLGGGTFLFSEPQPELRRLIDLSKLRWPPLSAGEAGLDIAATCTIAELHAYEAPAGWTAAPLIGECCRAFLASFKVWNMATVGGNICLGLPAGPMISLAAALDGSCVLWAGDGGERRLPVLDFVRGPRENALAPGELLRRIELPAAALARRFAFRRASLTPLGRSGVLVIGTLDRDGSFRLTVTAATRRPQRLDFPAPPDRAALAGRLAAALPPALYYDDVHGRPDWRRHMTHLFAEEVRAELLGEAA
ncbi:CO/xanthine dehydrogenase FAD-binding subunit [Ancylobacter sp. 3268]|uniref:FAD binding domain-containing protein n=1 Tax=Ancylobacter sp. 3268 TaxID=2817752 RepID=UPI00285942F0|nr:FAD binding domain-containing protein [Ancylobacter sp. 3268]MDR6955304.1 CO/xanthine dehydrogenase FAD-binding subunit [Ancylobacter sp. 3268]